MPYQRKGGRGLKGGSLRQQYNYYRRRAQERRMWEDAFKSATGRQVPSDIRNELYKSQTYDELFREGITRKINGRTEHITGERAVRIKIQSYKWRASKSAQTEHFINNYLLAMERSDYFDEYQIEYVKKLLHSISSDAITILMKKGAIPEIAFIYAQPWDVIQKLKEAIKVARSDEFKKELKETREIAKELYEFEKARRKILFGKRFM